MWCAMAKYLVVAHETVTNPRLIAQVQAVTQQDPQAQFVLLVPATPVRHLLFRWGGDRNAEAVAHKRVEKGRAVFAKKGVDLVDARVGPGSPVDAIDEEVRAHPDYAGFVISTLPAEKSRWLQMDLPRRVESTYHLPVYHVEAPLDWTAGDLP